MTRLARTAAVLLALAATAATAARASAPPPDPLAVVRGKDGDAETVRIGDAVHAARVGSTVLVSNKPTFLKEARALRSPGGRGEVPSIAERKSLQDARKLLPKDPLVWLWLDFASV